MTLAIEELRELLHYDRATGIFRWRVTRTGTARAGSIAGRTSNKGYRQIKVYGNHYFAHRLAWLWVHGEWPSAGIDHINTDKTDNRIENLRQASPSQNGANRPVQSNNTSGLKGVCWNRASKKWQASAMVGGRLKYLGLFDSREEAHGAYCVITKETFGEFARTE